MFCFLSKVCQGPLSHHHPTLRTPPHFSAPFLSRPLHRFYSNSQSRKTGRSDPSQCGKGTVITALDCTPSEYPSASAWVRAYSFFLQNKIALSCHFRFVHVCLCVTLRIFVFNISRHVFQDQEPRRRPSHERNFKSLLFLISKPSENTSGRTRKEGHA